MITIDVTAEAGDWPAPPVLETLAHRAIAAAVGHLPRRLSDEAEVSLLFTDDARMRQLNSHWRGKDNPTNVLSFAANESGLPGSMLGDIVLAHETVDREAREQHKPFADHLTHLVIHGFLHLLGYDHETGDAQADEMETLEREICATLGIADPYGHA